MNERLDADAEARARDLASRTPWTLESAREVVRAHAEFAPDSDFEQWVQACLWYGLDGLVALLRSR